MDLNEMYINPSKSGGHYMYHGFNIQQFSVLPTQCICVFCVDLKTNSHYFLYFLYSIDWLVFITEKESVYCAVRTSVPLTAEVRVRSQVSPCEFCGGQSGTKQGFSPSTPVSPVTNIPPMLDNRFHLRKGETGRALEHVQKQYTFRISDQWTVRHFQCFQRSDAERRPRLISAQPTVAVQ
jgi:hypothetical protein